MLYNYGIHTSFNISITVATSEITVILDYTLTTDAKDSSVWINSGVAAGSVSFCCIVLCTWIIHW